jgi:hypothetical protein
MRCRRSCVCARSADSAAASGSPRIEGTSSRAPAGMRARSRTRRNCSDRGEHAATVSPYFRIRAKTCGDCAAERFALCYRGDPTRCFPSSPRANARTLCHASSSLRDSR